MFTQCPDCQTIHPLTLAQLRTSRGMLHCRHCSARFDALERISETKAINQPEKPASRRFPWDKVSLPDNTYWRTGLVLGLLLLIGQIVYFNGYDFTQNPAIRLRLEKLCRQINCQLPVYKNLGEFTLLQSSFTSLPDQNYAFRVVISNQADFSQTYPNIQLTLIDYNGIAFAHRVFSPQDYLPEGFAAAVMPVDAITEISLKIAAPKTKVGGSTFDLIY